MKLEEADERLVVRINDDAAEHGVRPSVDYLLRSATDVLHGRLLAVIMTGMGRDGLAGCRRVKEAGGVVYAQHQNDCVVYGMPKADREIPLSEIARAIAMHVKRSHRANSGR